MSETQMPAPALPALPNYAVASASTEVNGVLTSTHHVTFGSPLRQVEFKTLDMADFWDLSELTGASENKVWSNMALIAASVITIDAVPIVGGMTRENLRVVLRKLGTDGLQAVQQALGDVDTPAAHRTDDAFQAAVKN